MLVKVMKSKLHRARVTETQLHYSGSIAIDPELMEAVGIFPYESVLIADVDNGNRFETYVVPAEKGSADIIVLGAAANLVNVGDIVIIIGFGYCTPDEVSKLKPKVVELDEINKIIKRIS